MRLHSIHDREGYIEVPEGGFVVDTIAISENPQPVNYSALSSTDNWIIRVNWGYGDTGTIPIGGLVNEFVRKSAEYLLKSSGYHAAIIGNEPNHEGERPNGIFIDPEHAAWVFSTVRNLVKTQNSQIRFITPPCAPYHANPMPWREYLHRMLLAIEDQGSADGIGIHAYARSMNPSEATSDEKMRPPLEHDYRSFRTYLDALSEVPPSLKHLPAYITEFNPIPDWENLNTGIIRAVYDEIQHHNAKTDAQKVFCLSMFRWNHFDGQRWGIEDKPLVIEDFRQAVAQTAGTTPPDEGHEVSIPIVGTGEEAPPEQNYPFYIDPQAVEYGVQVVPAVPSAGDSKVWKAVNIQFLDVLESQGRHHFYFDTLDENGNRLTGDDLLTVWWPSGVVRIDAEAKPGELYSANFPFSPGKNAFSSKMNTGEPSDSVTGAGMGADTPGGFNPGMHTSVTVVYRKFDIAKTPIKPKITIISPLENMNALITQGFGENPQDYAKWGLKGHNGVDFAVPLGSIVKAVDKGTVIEQLNDEDGYGIYIKIKHSWGESLYAHLQEVWVTVGQAVVQGQRIGSTGSTGNSTGPHLHFGMRVDPYDRQDGYSGYTDPLRYLRGTTQPKPEEVDVDVITAIKAAAEETGLEWELLASLAWAESSFDPEEENGGLMQLSEDVWIKYQEELDLTDIDNPLDNARAGAYYLKHLLLYYDGNIPKAVLAYNFGPGNVDKGAKVPALTLTYVDKVMHGRDLLKALGVPE